MNEQIRGFTEVLSFCDQINGHSTSLEIKGFDAVNELSHSFMKIFNDEKSKLPYHINLLDLLWANENAHSRIFAELLKQRSGNNYDILDIFLKYLAGINPNFNHLVQKPKITSEMGRIDLLVLDKEYALIIENKIHFADDQGAQIARYIERVKSYGYLESQIYVIYLTRDGTKKLEDQSWIYNEEDYSVRFSKRYFPLSFKENVLPLLKKDVLPNCKVKDVYLKSTIEQYVDHLEGMFNLRKIHYKMNSELQKHIKGVLELNSAPEINHPVIKNKLAELVKVADQIREMLRSTEQECWIEWLRRLRRDFDNYEIIDRSNVANYKKVGIVMEINGLNFDVLIEFDGNTIYYGIARRDTSSELNKDLKPILKPCLAGLKESPNWYGWKSTSFKNGYSRLESLIKEVEKHKEIYNRTEPK